MPDGNGLELVERIRQSYPGVPVLLMTAGGNEKLALEALRRGAASYVPKFNLENDPALIPVLVKQLQEHLAPLRMCDQTGLIRIGVALEEALVNGMYHGNLAVGSDLRQDDECRFHQVIEERRHLLPYSDRRLNIVARMTTTTAEFVVSDQGAGFDPKSLPDPTDPANLETVGGRGLLLIQTFMDEVRFNAAGNQITMVKRAAPTSAVGRPLAS
jgi:anti-sigma regulatory factor (Ser/Thr protein kinase)